MTLLVLTLGSGFTERRMMKLGDRVFVAGNVGRYGRLTAIIRTLGAPYYMVALDGNDYTTGPYTEVWPELKAPKLGVQA